jgi:hypothetical protein
MKKANVWVILFVISISVTIYYQNRKDLVPPEIVTNGISDTSNPKNKTATDQSDRLINNSIKPQNDLRKPFSNHDLIEKLTSTGNAKDAFEAFQIVNRCVQGEEFIRASNLDPIDPKNKKSQAEFENEKNAVVQACDGISEQQKRARIENLKKAIEGNVKDSALEFMNLGPFGDMSALISRPKDPLVMEWKKQAVQQLEKEANLGHSTMFISLMHVYEEGVLVEKNLEMAATYGVARIEAQRLQGEKKSLMINKHLNSIQANMSSEKKKEIEAAGIKIAQSCCAKK